MTDTSPERAISGEVVVDAPIEDVWAAWTTEQGIKSFFAPACNVELRPDGPYEIFFIPDAEPGMRGADDMRVLAFQRPAMLSFTWNAPPSLPNVRGQRTHVVVRLSTAGDRRTRVRLTHDGWGEGGEWDRAFEYFDRAWNDVVLPRLTERFRSGPVDWSDR
jgi:uncharacterized protein YndB with AHSA1/START domain